LLARILGLACGGDTRVLMSFYYKVIAVSPEIGHSKADKGLVHHWDKQLTANIMDKNTKGERLSVYEIGYLFATSIPEEKIPGEADTLKKIITDAGATIVADEAPSLIPLAYEMRKKTVSGSYNKYDSAYFGWVKFELDSSKVEKVKEKVELMPITLRALLTTTVRENTYLGKRATAVKSMVVEEKKEPAAAPATIEEMDKSIDDMVKEV
jgi:ribosomal protein S6